jgi:hypothetical protein
MMLLLIQPLIVVLPGAKMIIRVESCGNKFTRSRFKGPISFQVVVSGSRITGLFAP